MTLLFGNEIVKYLTEETPASEWRSVGPHFAQYLNPLNWRVEKYSETDTNQNKRVFVCKTSLYGQLPGAIEMWTNDRDTELHNVQAARIVDTGEERTFYGLSNGGVVNTDDLSVVKWNFVATQRGDDYGSW